jgi:hypothetical protein
MDWAGIAGCDIASRLLATRGSARSRIQASAKQIKQILSIKTDTTSVSEGVLVALGVAGPHCAKARRRPALPPVRWRRCIPSEHEALAKQEWLAIAHNGWRFGDQKIFCGPSHTCTKSKRILQTRLNSRKRRLGLRVHKVSLRRGFAKLGALILEERRLLRLTRKPWPMHAQGHCEMGLKALPWTTVQTVFARRCIS